MISLCPNTNSKYWKTLTDAFGEKMSYKMWHTNMDMFTSGQYMDLIEKYGKNKANSMVLHTSTQDLQKIDREYLVEMNDNYATFYQEGPVEKVGNIDDAIAEFYNISKDNPYFELFRSNYDHHWRLKGALVLSNGKTYLNGLRKVDIGKDRVSKRINAEEDLKSKDGKTADSIKNDDGEIVVNKDITPETYTKKLYDHIEKERDGKPNKIYKSRISKILENIMPQEDFERSIKNKKDLQEFLYNLHSYLDKEHSIDYMRLNHNELTIEDELNGIVDAYYKTKSLEKSQSFYNVESMAKRLGIKTEIERSDDYKTASNLQQDINRIQEESIYPYTQEVEGVEYTQNEDGTIEDQEGNIIEDQRTINKFEANKQITQGVAEQITYNNKDYIVLADNKIISLQDRISGKEVFKTNETVREEILDKLEDTSSKKIEQAVGEVEKILDRFGKPTAEIFNTVAQNVANRLGLEYNEYLETVSVLNTQRQINDVITEVVQGMRSVTEDHHGLQENADPEVFYQDAAAKEKIVEFVPSLDVEKDNLLIKALGKSKDFKELIEESESNIELATGLRQELNNVQKELQDLYRSGQNDNPKIPPLKDNLSSLQNQIEKKEKSQNVTFTHTKAIEILENELKQIDNDVRNTNKYVIQDFSDEWLDAQIDWQRNEQFNEEQAQLYETLKDNRDSRQYDRTLEHKREEQRNVLTEGLDYLLNAEGYNTPFKFLMINAVLNYNIGTEQQLSHRNENTVRYPNQMSSAVLPEVQSEMELNPDMHPLVAYDNYSGQDFLNKSERKKIAEKYIVEKRPNGYWVKFEQNGTEQVVNDLQTMAYETHNTEAKWCTGTLPMANDHNSQGDFYMFLDNNYTPQLAMRYEGNDKLEESRGTKSGQGIKDKYLDEAKYFYDNYKGGKKFIKHYNFNKLYKKLIKNGENLEKKDVEIFIESKNVGDGSHGNGIEKIKKMEEVFDNNKNIVIEHFIDEGIIEDGSEIAFEKVRTVKSLNNKKIFLEEIDIDGRINKRAKNIKISNNSKFYNNVTLSQLELNNFEMGENVKFTKRLKFNRITFKNNLALKGDINQLNVTNFTKLKGDLKINESANINNIDINNHVSIDGNIIINSKNAINDIFISPAANIKGFLKISDNIPSLYKLHVSKIDLEIGNSININTLKFEYVSRTSKDLRFNIKMGNNNNINEVSIKRHNVNNINIGKNNKFEKFVILDSEINNLIIDKNASFSNPLKIGGTKIANNFIIKKGFNLGSKHIKGIYTKKGDFLSSYKLTSPEDIKFSNNLHKLFNKKYLSIGGKIQIGNRIENSPEEIISESDSYIPIDEAPYEESDMYRQDERAAIIKSPEQTTYIFGKDSDISSPIHEIAHEYERVLTDGEKSKILNWTGHKKWTRETSEAFAKGFEKYLYEGEIENQDKEMENIFERFARALKGIIENAVEYFGDINELNNDMRDIYVTMLSNQGGNNQMTQQTTAEISPTINNLIQSGLVEYVDEVTGEPC